MPCMSVSSVMTNAPPLAVIPLWIVGKTRESSSQNDRVVSRRHWESSGRNAGTRAMRIQKRCSFGKALTPVIHHSTAPGLSAQSADHWRGIAMAKTVADQFAETLSAAGVKRIYGIVGDSLNGLTDAI